MSELIAKAIVCGAVAVMPGTVIAFFLTPVFMLFRQMISASMNAVDQKLFLLASIFTAVIFAVGMLFWERLM
jgi:hypothetical protein